MHPNHFNNLSVMFFLGGAFTERDSLIRMLVVVISGKLCGWGSHHVSPSLPTDIIRQPSEDEIIKLAPPPKKV